MSFTRTRSSAVAFGICFLTLWIPVLLSAIGTSPAAQAQVATQKTIAIGTDLYNGLLLASDGNFYTKTEGVATEGCADNENNNCATIYKVAPNGTTTVFHQFQETSTLNNADGLQPTSLIQGSDGNFYGTCAGGGSLGYGTIFKIAPDGTFTLLYDFPGTAATATSNSMPTVGGSPMALVEGTDGNLYGVAMDGYLTDPAGDFGPGLLFRLAKDGSGFTQVHIFSLYTAQVFEGGNPTSLMQADDGNFYVTMGYGQLSGGTPTPGAIDRVTPDGTTTVLANLAIDGSQGSAPMGPLAEGSDGSLYGLTATSASPPDGKGYAFKMSQSGVLQTIYHFTGGDAGLLPYGPLLLGSDGNLYGDTADGGDTTNPNCLPTYGCGLAFQMTTSGGFTDLHNFEGGIATSTSVTDNPKVDGATPTAPIVQGPGGIFYGATIGNNNSPTVFSLSLTSAIPSPIQLSVSPTTVNYGKPVTITWAVASAYSKTAQLCFGSVQGNYADVADSDGTWVGVQTGKLLNGVYRGTATVTPSKGGTYTYALTCGGGSMSGFARLVVNGIEALKIATTTIPGGSVGQPYQAIFSAQGGVSPYTWALAGDLPKGLSFANGVLSGKPLQFGTFPVAVGVQDSQTVPDQASASFDLVVKSTLKLPVNLLPAEYQKPYTGTIAASGGVPPYRYSIVSGELPKGLTLNATTGVISGTVGSSYGDFRLTFQVTDAENPQAQVQTSFTFETTPPDLKITSQEALPEATRGTPYAFTFQAKGGTPPYTWSPGPTDSSDFLPPGLSISSSGQLTGTPTEWSGGPGTHYSFEITVTDSGDPKISVTGLGTLQVASDLKVTVENLPNAKVGQFYQVVLTATGGVPPYQWSAASQPFPDILGLSLYPPTDADPTWRIGGLPILATTATVTLEVQDSEKKVASDMVTLPLVILPENLASTTTLASSSPSAGTKENVTFTATVSGGQGATPTGTVTFNNGGASLGTVTLDKTGEAALTTSFAEAGVYTITAIYSGDSTYVSSTSAAVTETVVTPGVSAAVSPDNLTIQPGASGQLTITLTPTGDYTGTVTFSCGTLPAHVSCTFAPPSVTIAAGSGPVMDTLTISTDAPSTSAMAATVNRGAPTAPIVAGALWLPGFALPGALAVLFGVAPRRRRLPSQAPLRSLRVFAILGLIACGLLSSCGGSNNDAKAGTYTIPVSVSVGGGATQNISVSVVIQ